MKVQVHDKFTVYANIPAKKVSTFIVFPLCNTVRASYVWFLSAVFDKLAMFQLRLCKINWLKMHFHLQKRSFIQISPFPFGANWQKMRFASFMQIKRDYSSSKFTCTIVPISLFISFHSLFHCISFEFAIAKEVHEEM